MDAADRKAFLDMALRRAQAGSGSDLSLLREEPPPYQIGEVVPPLSDVPHAIVGGLATARYMPARMTMDTNILVHPDDQTRAEAALKESGASWLGPLAVGGSTWRLASGRILDLLALDAPWVEEALRGAVPGPEGFRFIALPFLVLMKLESGRPQDLADISRMLGGAEEDAMDQVRSTIARHRPQDAEDLESLRILGRRE